MELGDGLTILFGILSFVLSSAALFVSLVSLLHGNEVRQAFEATRLGARTLSYLLSFAPATNPNPSTKGDTFVSMEQLAETPDVAGERADADRSATPVNISGQSDFVQRILNIVERRRTDADRLRTSVFANNHAEIIGLFQQYKRSLESSDRERDNFDGLVIKLGQYFEGPPQLQVDDGRQVERVPRTVLVALKQVWDKQQERVDSE